VARSLQEIRCLLWAAAILALNVSSRALTIVPIFDATITNDVNATTIESTINTAIQLYQTRFADPITVTIEFKEISTAGLYGQSSWWYYVIPYTQFRTALAQDSNTANDAVALSNLAATTTQPINGGSNVRVKTANLRAIGITGKNSGLTNGYDGIIGLHTSQLNLSRASTLSTKGDLMSITWHEIDEVLGLGSALDSNGIDPFPEDLFRYSSAISRSFTTNGDDAYFSIDGTNLLARFNQAAGADYGDWWSAGARTAQVQDAITINGKTPNPIVELIALDVIGYNLLPVPQPVITTLAISGTQVALTGTNGMPSGTYLVLSSANVATALSQWLPIATNFLNNSGPFTFTLPNAVNPTQPQNFFALQLQ
jgi:hypothetical protein